MRTTTAWGIVVMATFFLLSSNTLAGTFSFSWGGDQQAEPAPHGGQDKGKRSSGACACQWLSFKTSIPLLSVCLGIS